MIKYAVPPACLAAAIATAHITSQPIQVHDPETFIQTGRLAIVERPNPAAGFGKLLSLGFLGGFGVSTYQLLFKKEKVAMTKPVPQPQPTQAVQPTVTPAISLTPEPAPVQWDEEGEIEYDDEVPIKFDVEQAPETEDAIDIFNLIFTHRKKHLFVACETGSGKSTLKKAAIYDAVQRFGGKAEFYHWTAKAEFAMGLEDLIADDGKPHALTGSKTNNNTIEQLRDRLAWIVKRMESRQAQRQAAEAKGQSKHFPPIFCFIDEWLRTKLIAEDYGNGIWKQITDMVSDLFVAGREDNVICWLFTQDHRVTNCDLNKGIQKNVGTLVLGIDGNLGSLEDAFTGTAPIMPNKTTRESLWQEAQQLARSNPDRGIGYSNLRGHNLFVTPYLPDIKTKRLFGSKSNVIQLKKPEVEEDLWA